MKRPFNYSNPYMLGVNKREIKKLSKLVIALSDNFNEKESLLINEKISKFIKRMQGAIYSRDERGELAEQARVLQEKLLKIRMEKGSESMKFQDIKDELNRIIGRLTFHEGARECINKLRRDFDEKSPIKNRELIEEIKKVVIESAFVTPDGRTRLEKEMDELITAMPN